MLCLGLYVLIAGKVPANKRSRYEVRGWPARIIGIICLLPIPLSLGGAMVAAALMMAQGMDVNDKSFFWVGTAIEGGVVVACLVAILVIRLNYRTPVVDQPAEDRRAEPT